jgi:hypothetical protein
MNRLEGGDSSQHFSPAPSTITVVKSLGITSRPPPDRGVPGRGGSGSGSGSFMGGAGRGRYGPGPPVGGYGRGGGRGGHPYSNPGYPQKPPPPPPPVQQPFIPPVWAPLSHNPVNAGVTAGAVQPSDRGQRQIGMMNPYLQQQQQPQPPPPPPPQQVPPPGSYHMVAAPGGGSQYVMMSPLGSAPPPPPPSHLQPGPLGVADPNRIQFAPEFPRPILAAGLNPLPQYQITVQQVVQPQQGPLPPIQARPPLQLQPDQQPSAPGDLFSMLMSGTDLNSMFGSFSVPGGAGGSTGSTQPPSHLEAAPAAAIPPISGLAALGGGLAGLGTGGGSNQHLLDLQKALGLGSFAPGSN